MEWVSWFDHPVPEDVRGILIKYDDGIRADRYDPVTKRRVHPEGKAILGWRFMERCDRSVKTVQLVIREE